jgi:hypothetical protein
MKVTFYFDLPGTIFSDVQKINVCRPACFGTTAYNRQLVNEITYMFLLNGLRNCYLRHT